LRYFFGYGIVWTDEYARYMVISCAMIGSSVLVLRDGHTRITMLEDINPSLKAPFAFIRYLVTIAFAIVVLYLSIGALDVAARSTSPNMRISMTYAYICIPIMSVFMIMAAIQKMFDLFFKKAEPAEKVAEPEEEGPQLEDF
jgi:C4-dicarboxylate transporter DctQ subunit